MATAEIPGDAVYQIGDLLHLRGRRLFALVFEVVDRSSARMHCFIYRLVKDPKKVFCSRLRREINTALATSFLLVLILLNDFCINRNFVEMFFLNIS